MIWIVSGFVLWLLIAYSRQQDRIQAIEAELVKVRNTFRKLADERKAAQGMAETAPTGILPADPPQQAPDAPTAGGPVELPPQPATAAEPVIETPARRPSSPAPGPGKRGS